MGTQTWRFRWLPLVLLLSWGGGAAAAPISLGDLGSAWRPGAYFYGPKDQTKVMGLSG